MVLDPSASDATVVGPVEDAYEKLSRDVHQMRITGAIHQEWLENPKGYLLKPDFKRRAQHVGAGGKKLNSSRVIRMPHFSANTYKKRWFVLDGMILRYFKSENEETELGEIHLASVNAVLPSSIADAPDHALDLVCADRLYTIAGNDREDMVRWATVLTLVLRGEYKPKLMQRPESTIIRGSSVIPRPSRKTSAMLTTLTSGTNTVGRMTGLLHEDPDLKRRDDDVQEKIITVTFDQAGPLYLHLRGTVDDEVMVCGFYEPPPTSSSRVGPAEASGVIQMGDVLISINHYYFTNIDFQHAVNLIEKANRPLTLRFSRIDTISNLPKESITRTAEGWILAKEPAAERYRIRMLQLVGTTLKLFKPSMQGGRVDAPCLLIAMDQVQDIRPCNDLREAVSACTQCFPKQWGITLEGTRSIFTFYTRNQSEMLQWIDLLKNCPLFTQTSRVSIPVHPISMVEFHAPLEPRMILQDHVGKMGDLSIVITTYYFTLLDDGTLLYYINKTAATNRSRPIGTIRCDSIVSIIATNGDGDVPWRLELGLSIHGTSMMNKYKRSFIMCFTTQEQMLIWGTCISREAKRLTGHEYDISAKARRHSRTQSNHSTDGISHASISRIMTNSNKYIDPQLANSPPLYRNLKEVVTHMISKGWFYVQQPQSLGYESYHPRFIMLYEHELYFFKYEIHETLDRKHRKHASTILDLRDCIDVREAESGYQENLDFTIQLTMKSEKTIIWKLVAETHGQKETWLSTLIWISDYYFRGHSGNNEFSKMLAADRRAKHAGLTGMGVIMEADDELEHQIRSSSNERVTETVTDRLQMIVSECTEISGWLSIQGQRTFASIANGVFSYYESEEAFDNEWGDAIDSILLTNIVHVHSDGKQSAGFKLQLEGGQEIQLIASTATDAKHWMLVMCSCGGLILKKEVDIWTSHQPKEAWLWKMDRLYQVFRRRYFSLRNHQLLFLTEQHGRVLGIISLPCILQLSMSRICSRNQMKEADFYQLVISFAIPSTNENEQTEESDFYTLILAFETETMLLDWARAIYECCTNSMAIQMMSTVAPLEEIQSLPRELLKICQFEHSKMPPTTPCTQRTSSFSASGWLYYRIAKEERVRLRYFVQWGYELSIYKHEVLADEASAIRYGVIDCRALVDVRFAYINSPENAVELILGSDLSVVLIPRTDEEAVMWRDAWLDVKRAYGYLESGQTKTEIFGSGVFISRGSTFSTQRDNEALLRMQIEASVIFSTNLQEWDGTKWIPKYFVVTGFRVLVLSLALHLYDEEPDLLMSFAMKDVLEVRSCSEQEDYRTGGSKTACVITVQVPPPTIPSDNDTVITSSLVPPSEDESVVSSSPLTAHHTTPQEQYIVKCDSMDHCLEWMRLLCSSNGKLELKKNAATGLWGSVNRVASLSRHHSFMNSSSGGLTSTGTMNLRNSFALPTNINNTSPDTIPAPNSVDRSSRRVSRAESAKRRTSELLLNRKMSLTTLR